MKIRSLRLEHFRKFTDPIVLSGFTDGVNVLAESNEFGKSTILAAIRGVLFERHVSRAANVAAMKHRTNNTFPIVSLEFELPSGLHRIEKRFLHREPFARLTLPNGVIHHGDAAEEELQRILNFTQAGKTGSKPDNIGMWAALWVTQRDSVEQAALPDSARQTIHGCLEQEVGALAGGSRGKNLLIGVRGELKKIRDGNRKPAGRYKEALEQLGKAEDTLAGLQARRVKLLQDIESLAQAKRKLADAEAGGEQKRTEELLLQARQKREAAQLFEAQEKTAIATLHLCEAAVARAGEELTLRRQQQDGLTLIEQRSKDHTQAEAVAKAALEFAEAALNLQRGMVADRTRQCDQAGWALRAARAIVELASSAGNLQALKSRLVLADAAQARVNELVARLASLSITAEDVQGLRDLDRAAQATESTLQAQATHLSFHLLPSSAPIMLDDAPLTSEAVALIRDAVLTIAGVGAIQIRPGIRDRETLLASQAEQIQALQSALRKLSVDSLEGAEKRLAARVAFEAELKHARLELTTHTPADKAQKLPAGLEALRNQSAVLENTLKTGMAAAGLDTLPDLASAQDALRGATQREQNAAGDVGVARAPVADLERQHADALRLHAQAESRKRSTEDEQAKLIREHRLRLDQESEEALAGRARTAAESLLAQRSIVDALELSRPAESVAKLDAQIARYGQAIQQYARDKQQLQQDIAILTSRIEREEGVAIDEQVADAQNLVDATRQACDRYSHEMGVLELLLNTLEAAEREAKERYMAPIVRRVTPYLQTLFPGAAIQCDEEFQITGIIRELQQTESFECLSVGTQEQIAVLTRLAFADMLAEQGQPAMVILDDALVYSDADRMERMFDLLTEAAHRSQVLIFTCRGEIFARLGGTRLRVMPAGSR
jgi:energy-coupling factor transporter ATP-binding protein EcfA2